jgi:DNA-binding NtrC family response regulator
LNHSHQPRNVLIVEDRPSIHRVLDFLLAGLGSEGAITHNGYLALSMIERESLETLLLELRCSEMSAGKMTSAIKELRPKLVGRVLVITGDVSDPKILEAIKKKCWMYFSWRQVMQDLWERLSSLLGFSQSSPGSASRR